MLDNLRHSERSLWGPVKGAVTYAWKENKNELFSRLKRKALCVIDLSEKQSPKTKSNPAERSLLCGFSNCRLNDYLTGEGSSLCRSFAARGRLEFTTKSKRA